MGTFARLGVVAGAAVAACYGAGPVPKPAPGTQLVLVAPASGSACSVASFIGDVAVDSRGGGYAVMLPFIPRTGCPLLQVTPTVPVELWQFDGTGSQNMFASIAESDAQSNRPRVGLSGPSATPYWVYRAASSYFSLLEGSGGTLVGSSSSAILDIAGLVVDATTIYTAGWTDTVPYQTAIDNPDFPLFGDYPGPMGSSAFTLTALPIGGSAAQDMPVAPRFWCDQPKNCLVGNTDSLFYVGFTQTTGSAYVGQLPKAGSAELEISTDLTLPFTLGTKPSGLAANDQYVVWSIGTNLNQLYATPGSCQIFRYDLATKQTTQLLLSTSFACRDVEIDGDAVYFAIISVRSAAGDQNHLFLHGDGIGRITTGTGAPVIETLDLGIQQPAAGPRRVYVRGDGIYFVDPLAIVRIDKTALDGHYDFFPM